MLSSFNPISSLFKKRVSSLKKLCAIVDKNKRISYETLDYKSSKICNFILSRNSIEKRPIVVILKNSSEFLLIIMGIIKSNHPFLPIDPETPSERINNIISDSNPELIISDERSLFECSNKNSHYQIITKNQLMNSLENIKLSPIFLATKQNNIAYIIYTSGTSGEPKGVMINYKSLINYIKWAEKYYPIKHKKFVFFSSISFDLTLTSIFLPLLTGGTVFVYDEFKKRGFLNLSPKADCIKLTPSQLEMMLLEGKKYPNLKVFIIGGEQLTTHLIKRFIKKFKYKAHFFNEYGPTETTIGCIVHKYQSKMKYGSVIPIGLPIKNMGVYLLNSSLESVPKGVAGEIYLNGVGLAKGYHNRSEITAQKFFKRNNKRLYRTGDLAKVLENGQLQYLGRIDDQIKIRGYRIEIKEIEAVLMELDDVSKAIVKVIIDKKQNKKLAAYLILEKELTDNVRYKIILFLKKKLPDYMIPNYYIKISKIPLTINSKIDLEKLPSPITQISSEEKIVSQNKPYNLNKKEKMLIQVISKILDIPEKNIDIKDSFLLLGGDSLNAIELIVELKTIGYKIGLNHIFELPSIKAISKYLIEIRYSKNKNFKKVKNISVQTQIKKSIQKSEISKAIQSYLKPLEEMNIFSGSIIISKAKNKLFEYHSGFANKQKNKIICSHTNYSIGSITKTFTATSIMQLIEKRKLSLYDSISQFFESLHWKNIQIVHLLTHTAGLPQFEFLPRGEHSVDKIIKKYTQQPLSFEPGTRYKYSNLGYVLLTKIIEILSSMTFKEYLEKNIFSVIGLKNIGFLDFDYYNNPNAAIGYNTSYHGLSKTKITNCIINSGTSSLFASPMALIEWGNQIFEDKLIKSSTKDIMMKPYFGFCGLGWKITTTPYGYNYCHFGDSKGYSCVLSIYPKDQSVIAICCNSDTTLNRIEKDIANIIFGNSYTLPKKQSLLSYFECSTIPWKHYIGKYVYPTGEKIHVLKLGNTLCIKKQDGRKEKLFPIKKSLFYSKRRFLEFRFIYENETQISGFSYINGKKHVIAKKL